MKFDCLQISVDMPAGVNLTPPKMPSPIQQQVAINQQTLQQQQGVGEPVGEYYRSTDENTIHFSPDKRKHDAVQNSSLFSF